MFKVMAYTVTLTLTAWGVNLEEAVQRALLYNPLVKQYEHNYKASQSTTQAAGSGFLPSFDVAYGYNAYSKPSFVGANASSSATGTVSYNLFNGFKDVATLKRAQSKEKLTFYQKKAALEDLKLRVGKAYINVLRMQALIKVAQDVHALLKKESFDAQNFYQQGLFAKNETLLVDVELLRAKQDLLKAQSNLDLAYLHLKRELGGRLEDTEVLDGLKLTKIHANYKELLSILYAHRSELKILTLQQKDLIYQSDAVSSAFFPLIDVNVKYQAAGDDFIPNGGVSFLRHDESSYGLKLTWNLYEGGKSHYQRQSLRYQTQALKEGEKDLKLQLQLQLKRALQTYHLSIQQIEVAKMGLQQAKEHHRIVTNQFQSNIASTTQLLESQRVLTQARVALNEANFTAYDTVIEIERIVEKKLLD